jgi:hypothetical protein
MKRVKRLYVVRVLPPPAERSPKVVSLVSRRQARLERLDPKYPRPPRAAA